MKNISWAAAIALVFLMSCSSASAQELTLNKRSVIELSFGLWGGSRVTNTMAVTGVRTSAEASSFSGNLLYAYGLRENVAVTLSVGMMAPSASAEVGVYGTEEQAGTVVPILLGMRYYVPSPESGAMIRPFLSLGVGTYIASQMRNSVGTTLVQESQTESSFGGRIGVGLDLYTSDVFKFVLGAGYNFMTDFSSPVNGRDNFDGGDFTAGIGFAL